MSISADVVVGLLTLLGLVYIAWTQTGLHRAEARAGEADAVESSAGAVNQMMNALLQAIETVSNRDSLIAELRARIEILEQSDRLKMARIAELERKVEHLEFQRQQLIQERDSLAAKLQHLSPETP